MMESAARETSNTADNVFPHLLSRQIQDVWVLLRTESEQQSGGGEAEKCWVVWVNDVHTGS